ncbi:hypothetical protein P167DRAFT_608609 [Morchella conica CCBAS932]|uniref:Uncharacterized protein n=1 Tax=Morchella conica CCBAS932 TaxID=1392247 RepID=A0A3N4KDI6_9PEZI|nr:hypothetical protein P167DRAFT_608609 [Morchella conica CCBAS932]
MKCISGLCLFLLHLSVALALEAPRSRPYYGASPRHEATKHEQENLVEIIFENFRDGEATILEEEVRSLLSDFVPAALKAAVKKNDPLKILPGIGDEGWSIVQMALVHLSSILLQHDLTFIGGDGGEDLSELWENACAGGNNDLAVWHGNKNKRNGRRGGSNTIAVCSSYFGKPATSSIKDTEPSKFCEMSNKDILGLKSTILLRELAQTSHVGEGLMPREEMTIEGIAAVQTGNAQGILQKTGEVNADLEQVNVDSFTLYVALTWFRSICKE